MAKLIKSYLDCSGGLNVDVAPDSLADNELRIATNIDLSERGSFSTREGTSPIKVTGTCPAQTSAATTEIILNSSASSVDDRYNGFLILIVDGTGSGQSRTISDYAGSTRKATVSVAWATQPDNTSVYEVIRKYSGTVEEIIAWERKDGTTDLLAIIGTSLYSIDTSDGTETLIIALSDKEIGYFIFQDRFYFTGKEDGVDKFWVYGGINQVETATVTGTITGAKQVETATIAGTITTAGNAKVTVTAAGMTGTPKDISVAVDLGDPVLTIASKIRAALAADSDVTAIFDVGGNGADVTLTRKVYAANDITLNIAVADDTCVGITTITTSTDTTAGVADGGGNATVIVTAAGMTGTPKTFSVAVTAEDTASDVAGKIRTALNADSAITTLFEVGGVDADVTLTTISPAANNDILNISIANGSCAGLTVASTSTDTTKGQALLSEVVPSEDTGNDLGPIKRCRMFIWHPKSLRIFAAGDPNDKTCLYYSEASNPSYFKAISKLYPSTADGPINSLSLFGVAMVSIYYNGGWVWKGTDPSSDASWEKLTLSQGVIAGKTTILTPNSLSFVGMGGIYALSPSILDYTVVMVTGIETIKNLSNNKVNNIIKAIEHRVTTFALYDQNSNKYMLAFGDDSANARNNKLLVFQWEMGSFVIYDGLEINNMCQLNDGTILASSGNYVLTMDIGKNDWDIANDCYKAIYWQAESKEHSLGYPFNQKKIKRVLFAANQMAGELSSTDVRITCDYKEVDIDDIKLDDSFRWGDLWGEKWGWLDLLTKEIKISARGNRISVLFEGNTLDESATIYGYAFVFKLKKPKGVRVAV